MSAKVVKGEIMSPQPMKFIFVCTTQNRVFESADFSVRENRGIVVDETGNRALNAKVELNEPCPFCGKKHVYRAVELICPFDGTENGGTSP